MKKRKRILAFILALTIAWPGNGMSMIQARAAESETVNLEQTEETIVESETLEESEETETNEIITEEQQSESETQLPETEGAEELEEPVYERTSRVDEDYATVFSDADEWETFPGRDGGTWTINNNQYKIDKGRGNRSLLKDRTFTNFTYEADVTVHHKEGSDSAQAGLLFRVAGVREDEHTDGFNGYYFGIDAENKNVILGKVLGEDKDQWNEIGTKKMTIDYNKKYHLKVEVSGNHIVGYVEDVNDDTVHYARIDLIDDSFTGEGRVGVRNYMSNASFENVSVSAYTETVEDGYINSLLGMCADPDVLYHDGIYYLYPTNAGDANDDQGIKVYTSTDLVHWADQGFALKKEDVWGNYNFWAPDVIEKDGKFYMYYTAEEHIGVAISDSPIGPFIQSEKKPMHENIKEIDAHVFEDDDGQLYIYFVRFDNGNIIEGAKLNADMMTIDESSRVTLLRANQSWEKDMANINEGPFMLKKDGVYYLTYSGAHFESPKYGSGYATSTSPLGTFTKYVNNPIMQSNASVKGAGHHGIIETPEDGMYMVYHRHKDDKTTEPREFCIDPIRFTSDADGNTVLEVNGPTTTPQAAPAHLVNENRFIQLEKESLEPITVANGTAVSDWNLAEQVQIVTTWGKEAAAVVWDTDVYDEEKKEEQVLTITGTVTLPESQTLTITVEVTVEEFKTTEEALQELINKVDINNKDNICENITLPEEIDGYKISWVSENEDIVRTTPIENNDYYAAPAGVVTRQDTEVQVKLTAKINDGDIEVSKEFVLNITAKPQKEEYVGYLYTHFKEYPGASGEQDIFFGISKNGLDWTALNNNEAVLKSTVGDMKVRDPYVIRSHDGDKFYLIATDQDIYQYGSNIDWNKLSTKGSQALTIWESTDLVEWTNHRRVVVADTIEAGCAWAPEAIYDEATGEYLVYWSSKVKGDDYARQYSFVSKTRDFYTFTEPELFNNLETSNIDTSMFKEGDKYYKLLKLEMGDDTHVILQSAAAHPLAYGDSVEKNQVTIGDRTYRDLGVHYTQIDNSGGGCLESFKGGYEGATMFKFNDRNEWCIMVDEYSGNPARGYIPFTSKNLDAANSVRAKKDGSYVMQDGGKHGSMIPITQSEYDALMAKWGAKQHNELKDLEKQTEPILRYDFEESHNGTDIENKSEVALADDLNGSLHGTTEYRYDEEKAGNVLYTNGSGYGQLPTGLFDGMENVTISMDVKPETTDQNHVDFCIGQDQNKYLFLRFRNWNGQHTIDSGISVRSWQNEYKLTDNKNTLNKWVNVKIVMEDHKMSMYIDNEAVYENQHVRSIPELGENLIAYLGKAFYPDPNFKGSYDNVEVYNYAMSKEEIMGTVEEPETILQRLEAEDAIITKPAKTAEHAGASGGKKVGWIDDSNATVNFTINAPTAGKYRVDLIAGSDFINAAHKYYVNYDKTNAKVIDYVNAGFDNWKAYPVEVELEAGENIFTVTHAGKEESFAELDYIDFYSKRVELEEITLDGKPFEGFDWKVHDYEVDVQSLTNLPVAAAKMPEETKDLFEVTVKQATAYRPEVNILVKCETMPEFDQEYRIRFITPDAFTNPLVNYGADPYVTYQDGYYYYVRVLQDREIYVSKAAELGRIGEVEPKLVYKPQPGEESAEMWAPEIHYLNGKWYIYYTAGAGSNHRMYALECDTAQGTYEHKGELKPETVRWAIDQTVLEHNGKLYAIWSGWDGFENVDQRLYIAEMSDPTTIIGDRVEISRPEYDWEKMGGSPHINEGAQIVKSPNGVVNILYSASGSWSDDYCLGALTLKENGDPMNTADWNKAEEPLFKKNMSSTYSTGHACFTTSPDGSEDYIVYHATRGSGESWAGRGVRAQRIYWNEDGTVDIGMAIDFNSRVNLPSGTVIVARERYEAENGKLAGTARIAATYNSSNGKKITGLTEAGSSVTFNVNAAKAGKYKMYIGAATILENAGLQVQVNEDKAVEKEILPFNSLSNHQALCTDNWAGYELEVKLKAGNNTIQVGNSSEFNGADLDYIELELISADPEVINNKQLNDLYEEYQKLNAADYEEAGYTAFKNVLKNVKDLLNNPSATQAEINAAVKALQEAAGKLVPKTLKGLNNAITEAGKLNKADYTEESWARVEKALTAAKAVANRKDATEAEVKKANEELQAAVNALVKKTKTTPTPVKTVPKKGIQKTVGKFVYKVTKSDAKNGTVTLVKPTKKTMKTVKIPAEVTIDGYKFKVTQISAKAFSKNKKLKKVTIGKNVKVIGSKAFYKCKKLKKVTIKSKKIKTVGKNAFKGITKKAYINVPNKKAKAYKKIFKKAGLSKTVKLK